MPLSIEDQNKIRKRFGAPLLDTPLKVEPELESEPEIVNEEPGTPAEHALLIMRRLRLKSTPNTEFLLLSREFRAVTEGDEGSKERRLWRKNKKDRLRAKKVVSVKKLSNLDARVLEAEAELKKLHAEQEENHGDELSK